MHAGTRSDEKTVKTGIRSDDLGSYSDCGPNKGYRRAGDQELQPGASGFSGDHCGRVRKEMAKRFLLALILCGAAARSQDRVAQAASNRPSVPQPKGLIAKNFDASPGSYGSRTASAALPAPGPVDRQAQAGLIPASATDKLIEALQDRVRKAPGDYAAIRRFRRCLFQKARETGDITYYDLAEQTLKRSLDLVPQDFRAADPLVHMCLVYMGEHRFSEVVAYAQKAIALGSGNLAAFAVEGDAYTDMGDYDAGSSGLQHGTDPRRGDLLATGALLHARQSKSLFELPAR